MVEKGKSFTTSVKNVLNTVNLAVTKKWTDDGLNSQGHGAGTKEVKVRLMYYKDSAWKVFPSEAIPEGQTVDVVLSQLNGWTNEWTKLPGEYLYKAVELIPGTENAVTDKSTSYDPDEYTTSYLYYKNDGNAAGKDANGDPTEKCVKENIINKRFTSLTVSKVWDDRNERYVARPTDDIIVRLQMKTNGLIPEWKYIKADGTETDKDGAATGTLNYYCGTKKWSSCAFAKLPYADADGDKILYRAEETVVDDDYEAGINTVYYNGDYTDQRCTVTNTRKNMPPEPTPVTPKPVVPKPDSPTPNSSQDTTSSSSTTSKTTTKKTTSTSTVTTSTTVTAATPGGPEDPNRPHYYDVNGNEVTKAFPGALFDKNGRMVRGAKRGRAVDGTWLPGHGPLTGDNADIFLWIALMIAASLCAVYLIYLKKRQREAGDKS